MNGRMVWLNRFDYRDGDKELVRKMIHSSNQEFFKYSNSITDSRALIFFSLSNWRDLSCLLNVTPLQLEQIINNPSYIEFKIPKKKGKPRLICQPKPELMKIQRRLNSFLQAVYDFHIPSCVHGFVPKSNKVCRSIVSNAKSHLGKKNILTIDLQDFFTSIRAKRVKKLFQSWGMDHEVSIALTLLCTFKGSLPMGAPTSPILANLCSNDLDLDLNYFCKKNQLTYTRYADDLTFSSNYKITDEQFNSLIQFIEKHGFLINKKKTRRISNNRKQKITGIIVNEKLSVERKLKKKLRAINHDILSNGLANATKRHFNLKDNADEKIQKHFANKINGLNSFVKLVENQRQ